MNLKLFGIVFLIGLIVICFVKFFMTLSILYIIFIFICDIFLAFLINEYTLDDTSLIMIFINVTLFVLVLLFIPRTNVNKTSKSLNMIALDHSKVVYKVKNDIEVLDITDKEFYKAKVCLKENKLLYIRTIGYKKYKIDFTKKILDCNLSD